MNTITERMNKTIQLVTSALLLLLCMGCTNAITPNESKELVILDTDMVPGLDDGLAMLMLAQTNHIDLLGVTVVAGNTHVNEGLAYTIRQLEIIGKGDVPVAPGAVHPLRRDRIALMAQEVASLGDEADVWLGSGGYNGPADWESFYVSKYNQKPTIVPIETSAADFIIDQVKKNPHQITIAAIGPCTNLALAVQKAPEIIPLIKRVIYMGGAFYCDGNTTPASEFNTWFDPEAADIMMKSAFNEQLFFGLDVCNTMELSTGKFDELRSITKWEGYQAIMDDSAAAAVFSEDANAKWWVWDLLVAAYLIDPTIVTHSVNTYVRTETEFGPEYGRTIPSADNPGGLQKVEIVLGVDVSRFWEVVESGLVGD